MTDSNLSSVMNKQVGRVLKCEVVVHQQDAISSHDARSAGKGAGWGRGQGHHRMQGSKEGGSFGSDFSLEKGEGRRKRCFRGVLPRLHNLL